MPPSTFHSPSLLSVEIANRQRIKKINARLLKQVVVAVMAELKISEAELGIQLVGPNEMARVNWQFLQHEGSTDVITFDHGSKDKKIHGELFICVAEAMQQAKEFGTSWQAEVVRYAVHGVLHLLGYDDLKPELRRVMKREENRLVHRLAGQFSGFAGMAGKGKAV